MNVNFHNQTISKLNGKRTLPATITFKQLFHYIGIWNIVVGPMLASTQKSISNWRNAGQPQNQIYKVLQDIIVTFGVGHHRVWPKVAGFLRKPGGIPSTNGVIVTVNANINKLTAINIVGLFVQLKSIKGLGSKVTSPNFVSDCAYASKVLRCFSDNHVVLDGLIENELAEPYYIDFRQKCEDIGQALSPKMTPAQVEGGLYAWLQVMNPCQRKACWKTYQKGSRQMNNSKTPTNLVTPQCEDDVK